MEETTAPTAFGTNEAVEAAQREADLKQQEQQQQEPPFEFLLRMNLEIPLGLLHFPSSPVTLSPPAPPPSRVKTPPREADDSDTSSAVMGDGDGIDAVAECGVTVC